MKHVHHHPHVHLHHCNLAYSAPTRVPEAAKPRAVDRTLKSSIVVVVVAVAVVVVVVVGRGRVGGGGGCRTIKYRISSK